MLLAAAAKRCASFVCKRLRSLCLNLVAQRFDCHLQPRKPAPKQCWQAVCICSSDLNYFDIWRLLMANPAPAIWPEAFPPKEGDPAITHKPIGKTIIIGAGPAGIRCAQELLKRRPHAEVEVFSNEPYQPYNRIQLSALLAGEMAYEQVLTELPDSAVHINFRFTICAIDTIDHRHKQIIDALGNTHNYDNLVIATGARPHLPNIPGLELPGVYTFRSLKDTEQLYSRTSSARHIVVVGGGLLGLEAARALLRNNTKVTVVQQNARLMNRQLDDNAAQMLQRKMESMGITFILNSGVRQVLGSDRVTGVVTRDKQEIPCDTVLVCAGIKPNKEIARDARIHVGEGINVDDQLGTSIRDIYAIGECCEHRGITYGLASPGFEQAAICADVICGGNATYTGSQEASKLKVVGEAIFSMGEVADLERRPFQRIVSYRRKRENQYRKLVVRKGRLTGILSYGEWAETRRVQEAFHNSRRIWPWQLIWFFFTGNLFFLAGNNKGIRQWPADTVICQCNAVPLEQLIHEIDCGASSVSELQTKTGAGTVCGSCKPLLEQLTEYQGPREKETGWVVTALLSFFALAVAVLVASTPGLEVSSSALTTDNFEQIWNDKFWKQVTGFSLLGMSLIGLVVSLRKKLPRLKLGNFSYWRIFHMVLGFFCAITLILHTGFHLGENFNQILMLDFLLVLALGSLTGAVLGLGHWLSATAAGRLRKTWQWAHILVAWPLPVLLLVHILTVYYF
jgi:nitrite reductase (NADH) large subunit